MRVAFDHLRRLPTAELLQLVKRCSGLHSVFASNFAKTLMYSASRAIEMVSGEKASILNVYSYS